MLAISPGVSGLGKLDSVAPSEAVKALVETGLVSTAAVMITKSYVPFVVPIGYLLFSAAWRNEIGPAIDDATDEAEVMPSWQ